MTYIRDMETLLRVAPLDAALERLEDRSVAERTATELRAQDDPAEVDWSALATEAGALASALEQIALDADTWSNAQAAHDGATLIRARAGGPGRRGPPFDWTRDGAWLWTAVDPGGTDWAVTRAGRRFGVTIANWDWPDWLCASPEEARAVAEEIYARPEFPDRLAVSDVRETPLDPQPPLPRRVPRCPHCETSEPPVAVAAVLMAPTGDYDPIYYYRCPSCNRDRGDVEVDSSGLP